MDAIEIYRGYEIHPDLAGYGYMAHQPNYDGEPCLHDMTIAGVKAEIDEAVADAEPAVNLLAAKNATVRIRALADQFDNHHTQAERDAIGNLLAGRPAFWSTARYSNAPATTMLELANHLASIRGAVDEAEHHYPHAAPNTYRTEAQLDRLLPLNDEAVRDLRRAYHAIGAFRDDRAERTPRAAKPAINAGSLVTISGTSEKLTVVAVDGAEAWIRDDLGARMVMPIEALVGA